jgi:HEAT repeat protein
VIPALGGRLRASDRVVVEEILLDHLQRVRGADRDRLARAYDELGYVDRHLEGLGSARWWRRAQAAERLGIAGVRRAHEALVAALRDDVAEVRIRAAKALGAVGGRASAVPLLEALQEPNRWSTIRVADILTEMGREVTDELMAAFPRLEQGAKLAALDILGRIRPLESVPWLLLRLSDGEPDVRARAAHALGSIGEPGSGPALAEALADPDWPVRAMAAKALGRVHWPEGATALARALSDREWWVRANAAEALRSLGPRGLAELDRALDDDDRYARHQAIVMLQQAGEVDRRVAALAGTEPVAAEAAERWLLRVARAGEHGRLQEIAATHPDPEVRERLAAVLARVMPADSAAGAERRSEGGAP